MIYIPNIRIMIFISWTCLCLPIAFYAAGSFATAQPLPPEVDLDDGDMFFCDEAMGGCESAASGEDIDNPSDWLGPNLLQTDIHVLRDMTADVKAVHISGEADVESQMAVHENKHHSRLPQVQISGDADVTSSQQPAVTESDAQHVKQDFEEEGVFSVIEQVKPASESVRPKAIEQLQPQLLTGSSNRALHLRVLLTMAVLVMLLASFHRIRAHYKGLSTQAACPGMRVGPPDLSELQDQQAMEKKKLFEKTSASYGAAPVQACSPNIPQGSPEWTTVPTPVQPNYSCPAALRQEKSTGELITAHPETPNANQPLEENKQPGLQNSCSDLMETGARFVLPPQSLDRLGSGHWNATGMSGKAFLRVAIIDVPETGHSSLSISMCSDEANFTQKWKFSKSPLTGALPIYGSQGEHCGTLEPLPGGRCLVKHLGKVVMSLEIGNHVNLHASASDPAGRPIAFSVKSIQAGFCATEAGETWKVQCRPEADAVFIAGCMLAFMLLGAGAGAGTPAFSKLSK